MLRTRQPADLLNLLSVIDFTSYLMYKVRQLVDLLSLIDFRNCLMLRTRQPTD